MVYTSTKNMIIKNMLGELKDESALIVSETRKLFI